MSLMAVPTSRHGDSLPAELRVGAAFRNSPYFSRARFAAGQKGLTQAPALTLNGLRGLWGLGQDDGGDEGSGDGGDGSGSGGGGSTASCAGTLCADGSVMNADCVCGVPAPPPLTLPPTQTPTPYASAPAGSICYDSGGNAVACSSVAAVAMESPYPVLPSGVGVPSGGIPGYSGPTSVAPNSATPAAPTGYQWAQMVNSSGQTLAKVLAISQGGSAITLPNGEQLLFGSATSAAAGSLLSTSSLGSLLPLLLIGGGLWLIMSMRK
jgi:hypothetical protein